MLLKRLQRNSGACSSQCARVIKRDIFWDVMFYNVAEVYRCFWGMYCLHFQGKRVSSANKQAVRSKMEAAHSYEASRIFFQTILRHIPEDSTLHSQLANVRLCFWKMNMKIIRRIFYMNHTFSLFYSYVIIDLGKCLYFLTV